jgi:hypothetical protein
MPRLQEEWEPKRGEAEVLRSLLNSTEWNATNLVPPNFKDILSGILTLAAREGECVPVAKIHSILYEMITHEPILSGLRFSLTGDVCYSRDVDQAIKNLLDWGSLKIVGESALMLRGVHSFRTHLSRTFTKSQIQAIHSASLRYCNRLRRDVPGIANNYPASNRIPKKAPL